MGRVTTSMLALALLAALCASCARGDGPAVRDTSVRTARTPSARKLDSTPAPPRDAVIAAAPSDPYEIWEFGVGSIRLGMTLDDIRRAFPKAKFERTSDGEGVALVSMTFEADTKGLILFADEVDPDTAIDWSKAIENIQVFSEAFHTAQNIHPGSLVTDVEKVYGNTTGIILSEIESRQYISFEKPPNGLDFRIDDSGVFEDNSRKTRVFQPGAQILSIAVR